MSAQTFPKCRHRTSHEMFWDGVDNETGRRVGDVSHYPACNLRDGPIDEATCAACRSLPTQATFEALTEEQIEAAVRRYCEAFDLWPKGVRSEAGPWAQALGALKDEVRKRADELQAEGAFSAEAREEYLSGAALVRGMMLGWCLGKAAVATEEAQ